MDEMFYGEITTLVFMVLLLATLRIPKVWLIMGIGWICSASYWVYQMYQWGAHHG